MAQYHFDKGWKVKDFVRGTIRLNGWAEAWAPIFDEVEGLTGPEGDKRIAELAAELMKENSYAPGEPDRVVLFVSLQAERNGRIVWHQTWALDAWGDQRGSAMARLVSEAVALAVTAVVAGEMPVGVCAAPEDPGMIARWLGSLREQVQFMERIDHLA